MWIPLWGNDEFSRTLSRPLVLKEGSKRTLHWEFTQKYQWSVFDHLTRWRNVCENFVFSYCFVIFGCICCNTCFLDSPLTFAVDEVGEKRKGRRDSLLSLLLPSGIGFHKALGSLGYLLNLKENLPLFYMGPMHMTDSSFFLIIIYLF